MLTAELGEIADVTRVEELAFELPEEDVSLERDVLDVPERGAKARSLVAGAALASGLGLATMIASSVLRGRPPLAGLEVLARGVGLGRPRLGARMRPLVVGAGVLLGGALVLGVVDGTVRALTRSWRRTPRSA